MVRFLFFGVMRCMLGMIILMVIGMRWIEHDLRLLWSDDTLRDSFEDLGGIGSHVLKKLKYKANHYMKSTGRLPRSG